MRQSAPMHQVYPLPSSSSVPEPPWGFGHHQMDCGAAPTVSIRLAVTPSSGDDWAFGCCYTLAVSIVFALTTDTLPG